MGKFTDSFMNIFNSDKDEFDDEFDDDLYDDDLIDEDDDYEDEPEERGSLFGRRKSAEDREKREVREERREVAPKNTVSASRASKAPARQNQGGNTRMEGREVCIFKPSSIEDSREITETLLQGTAVVINFEGLHVEISQRIIDFISGSCYALNGNLQKISNYIFIATPNSVGISGDFQDLLGGDDGSFDISGFKSPLV